MIIGVDPGTIHTGFGIVRRDGNRLVRLTSGTIATDTSAPMEQRLLQIHRELDEVLTGFGPDCGAVEDIFFAKNAKSALKLGQARGVILVTMARHDIPITSLAPTLVKRSIVGMGRAPKGQMQRVVGAILGMKTLPGEDEADALAIAICVANSTRIR